MAMRWLDCFWVIGTMCTVEDGVRCGSAVGAEGGEALDE